MMLDNFNKIYVLFVIFVGILVFVLIVGFIFK